MLNWTSKDYEETDAGDKGVRFMRGTCLASDGEYIYALACYKEKNWDSNIKRIVCEVYELVNKTISLVKEVPLLREDGTTPYHGSNSNLKDHEGFANHCSIACNEKLLVLGTPNNWHVFDMETGVRKFKRAYCCFKVFDA
jgi:hypothetical protein